MYAATHSRFLKVLVLLLCLILSPVASKGAGQRLVAVTEEWPPFRINDQERPSGFRGIDIDLVALLAEKAGLAIDIRRHPWARALEMMRNGQADMITGAARTVERETFMHYVPISYCAVRPVFYTQKGRGQAVRSYEDLYGKQIGYSLRSAYFRRFDTDGRLDKVGLSTEPQLLKVLALQRLDIIVGTEPNISHDISRLGLAGQLEPTAYQPPDRTELFITLSRKSTAAMDLAPRIEQVLRELKESGAIESILERYR